MFNRRILVILLLAVAGGLGLLASQYLLSPPPAAAPALSAVQLFPEPRPIADFSLQQSDGTQLVPGELHGHWTVVFLGFTHCPDICPTTLAQLARAQRAWEEFPDAIRPRVLFVSVDPARDSPDRIGEYAHAFHRDTLAATADVPSLEGFARSLSLVFMTAPADAAAPDGNYSVDHSAALAVLDPRGRMAGVIAPPFDPAAIADDLAGLTRSQPAGAAP